MSKYICKHCDRIIKRKSKKKWIKSFCQKSGKTVHLILVNQ